MTNLHFKNSIKTAGGMLLGAGISHLYSKIADYKKNASNEAMQSDILNNLVNLTKKVDKLTETADDMNTKMTILEKTVGEVNNNKLVDQKYIDMIAKSNDNLVYSHENMREYINTAFKNLDPDIQNAFDQFELGFAEYQKAIDVIV